MSRSIRDGEPRASLGWDADRAATVITGVQRLKECGLASETECQQLMLRIASVSRTPIVVARHPAADPIQDSVHALAG